jgi:hypothetical protein
MSQDKAESRQVLIKPSKLPSISVGAPYSDPIIIGWETLLAQKVEALVKGKENNLSI